MVNVFVLNEPAMRGHYADLLNVVPHFSCILAMINKNKDSCATEFILHVTVSNKQSFLPLRLAAYLRRQPQSTNHNYDCMAEVQSL